MRIALFAGLLCLTLAPASAETLSQEIARSGLAATEARLIAAASDDPADAFGLGGVQFLRAVEQSYQLRWQTGLADPTGMLPFLRLPMEPNPAAATCWVTWISTPTSSSGTAWWRPDSNRALSCFARGPGWRAA